MAYIEIDMADLINAAAKYIDADKLKDFFNEIALKNIEPEYIEEEDIALFLNGNDFLRNQLFKCYNIYEIVGVIFDNEDDFVSSLSEDAIDCIVDKVIEENDASLIENLLKSDLVKWEDVYLPGYENDIFDVGIADFVQHDVVEKDSPLSKETVQKLFHLYAKENDWYVLRHLPDVYIKDVCVWRDYIDYYEYCPYISKKELLDDDFTEDELDRR